MAIESIKYLDFRQTFEEEIKRITDTIPNHFYKTFCYDTAISSLPSVRDSWFEKNIGGFMEFPYKVGDCVKIIDKITEWSSGPGGIYPWNDIKVLDIIKITKIEKENDYFSFNGEFRGKNYGFVYNKKTKDRFELVQTLKVKCIDNEGVRNLIQIGKIYRVESQTEKFYYIGDTCVGNIGFYKDRFEIVEERKEMLEYETIRPFNAEDLRKSGACDDGIEEFIKIFGFTKPVPVNSESLEKMRMISDCIPFLLRKCFIKKKKEVFYKIGDKFEYKGEYLLSQVGNNSCCLIALAGFDRGNRYKDPANVRDCRKITMEEFSKIAGDWVDKFKKIDY